MSVAICVLLGVGGAISGFGKTLTFVLDRVILYRPFTLEIHIYDIFLFNNQNKLSNTVTLPIFYKA